MPDIADANKQKLVSDMKVVVSDAEEILRATAGVAGDKMSDLRERIGERLRDAKLRIADAEAAYAALRQHVSQLQPGPAAVHAPVDTGRSQEIIGELRKLLHQGELNAIEVMRQNSELLSARFGSRFTEVENQVANFDFEAALATLEKLLANG